MSLPQQYGLASLGTNEMEGVGSLVLCITKLRQGGGMEVNRCPL